MTVLVSEGCVTAGTVILMQLGSMMMSMAHVTVGGVVIRIMLVEIQGPR